MVARVTSHEMNKDRDKPIRSFGFRVRGKAGVCMQISVLNCDCNTQISCSEHILPVNTTCKMLLNEVLWSQRFNMTYRVIPTKTWTLEEVFQFTEGKKLERDQLITYLNQKEWRVPLTSTNETNVRMLKIWYSTNQTHVDFAESMLMVNVSPAISKNNTARLTIANAITVRSPSWWKFMMTQIEEQRGPTQYTRL